MLPDGDAGVEERLDVVGKSTRKAEVPSACGRPTGIIATPRLTATTIDVAVVVEVDPAQRLDADRGHGAEHDQGGAAEHAA